MSKKIKQEIENTIKLDKDAKKHKNTKQTSDIEGSYNNITNQDNENDYNVFTGTFPIIAIRDLIVFPNSIIPLLIGRDKSVYAVQKAIESNRKIFIVTQKDVKAENIETDHLYTTGTIATIVQYINMPDGTIKILADVTDRARVLNYQTSNKIILAEVKSFSFDDLKTVKYEDIHMAFQSLLKAFKELAEKSIRITPEMMESVTKSDNIIVALDLMSSYLPCELDKKQLLLENTNLQERIEETYKIIVEISKMSQIEQDMQDKVKKQIEKNHKEYYLHEQMKMIKKELGDTDAPNDHVTKYEDLLNKTKLPEEVVAKVKEEINKLNSMQAMSSEASIIRNYLDLIFALPWDNESKVNEDIAFAAKTLDKTHYGLEEVKERILEYLAVQIKTKSGKGSIMLFYGPPGVGKTSLAKSIATATGREFIKISLGGLRDEAEIRGHRRTYLGAMPGKIINALKKAKTRNPVILLDELDKMSYDFRGDPASALLEVLDPEQNVNFNDHYLEVSFDLSKVMFIATANSLNVSRPLLDRMEVVRIPSYLDEDKIEICQKYIIPTEIKENGLEESEISFSKKTISEMIRHYTKESGVRELERLISRICRKVVKKKLFEESAATKKKDITGEENATPHETIKIDHKNMHDYLGAHKFLDSEKEKTNLVGISNGLAYTEVGGDILLIESVIMDGKGEIKITGKLGDVMKESATAAVSYIRSRAEEFGIKDLPFDKKDIHVHFPEGAIPKDGPSAGIAIASSLLSLFTNIPINSSVAMTGEITLRGRVLPIGGLREKLTAAVRSNIKKVLIPVNNMKDLEEIPEYIKDKLEIIAVENFSQVIPHVLTQKINRNLHHVVIPAKTAIQEGLVSGSDL